MTFYGGDERGQGIAAAYDQRLIPWLFGHWAERLVGSAGLNGAESVVDLACGTGLITRAVLERLSETGRVVGVDLDATMVAYAAGTVTDPRIRWHEADATQLPVATSTADVVVCHQGLQFFPDRSAALDEVIRVLRPGGRFVAAVWGRLENNPWTAALAIAMGDFLGDDARRGTESICSLGDTLELGDLLERGGFIDAEVTEIELTASHPDVRDAIDGQLAALPSAAVVDALGQGGRSELIDAMASLLGEYTSAGGALTVPSMSVLASAGRPLTK